MLAASSVMELRVQFLNANVSFFILHSCGFFLILFINSFWVTIDRQGSE